MHKIKDVSRAFRVFENKWVGAAENQADAVLSSFSFERNANVKE